MVAGGGFELVVWSFLRDCVIYVLWVFGLQFWVFVLCWVEGGLVCF